MWLLLETDSKSTATSYDVLQLVLSLGMPKEIARTRKGNGHVWGVRMSDPQVAEDARWVLEKHPDIVTSKLGVVASSLQVTNTPPTFETQRTVRGSANA
jgi:hypothetical protein